MIRVRFMTGEADYRPAKWPIKYPYWCTGYLYAENATFAIIIVYLDAISELKELWADAESIYVEEVEEIIFSSSFPRPEWYKG